MKKLTFIAFTILGLIACGGGENSSKENTTDESAMSEESKREADYKGMEMLDLTPYDIYASIYIPDASKGKPEISTTDWGSIEIVVGKNYGVEVAPAGLTVEEKKAELEADLVYSIEYIEDSPDKIVYKKVIKQMAENSDDYKPEVHFFMNVDTGGEMFEVKSLNNEYREKAIQ